MSIASFNNSLFNQISNETKYKIIDTVYESWTEVKMVHRSGRRVNHQRKSFHYSYPAKFKINHNGVEMWIPVSTRGLKFVKNEMTLGEYEEANAKDVRQVATVIGIAFLLMVMFFASL